MKMLQKKIRIISNKKITGGCYQLVLESPDIASGASPGQFVMLKVKDGLYPLLRRPFSIHSTEGAKIILLYEALGLGTEALSRRKKGEYLDALGPLGNGFTYARPSATSKPAILVAGGMGVAPLFFLGKRLQESAGFCSSRRQKTPDCKNIVLIGAKTKHQILCEKEFQKLKFSVKIATDDDSRGFRGRVTELLVSLLPTIDHRPSTIYACGPRPMLEEIARISKKYKISAQVSLEEHMACGMGICFGCAVNTRSGFKRACKDGPVFQANDIEW